MRKFRNAVRRSRLLLLAFLAVELFYFADGRQLVYAWQEHQQEERKLQEAADFLGISVERLRPEQASIYGRLRQLFGAAEEDPVRAAGLERLREVLREHEAQVAANPYREQIEAVKEEHAAWRIEGLLQDLLQLTDPRSGRALPEASQKALLRGLAAGLEEDLRLPLRDDLPAKARERHAAMQAKLDQLLGSVRPVIDDARAFNESQARDNPQAVAGTPPPSGTLAQKISQLSVAPAVSLERPERRPRFADRPLPTRRVELQAQSETSSVAEILDLETVRASKPEPLADGVRKAAVPAEFTALVDRLDRSPARIFSWVHDNVDFDPKWGAVRPPLGTFQEKAGTSWDQAWLLVELLRAADVEARFEWGEIVITPRQLQSLTGLEDPVRAGDLLTTAGTPVVLFTEGNEVIGARLSHVWVKAFVDYSPNRGAVAGPGDSWVRLGPSLKNYNVAPGLRVHEQVPFALGDYLLSGTELSPRRYYEDALWSYIRANDVDCATLEQLKPKMSLRPANFPFLPGVLQGKVVSVEGDAVEVPAAMQASLEISIRRAGGAELLRFTTSWPAVYGTRLEIAWPGATADDVTTLEAHGGVFETPPYLVELAPSIRVDGVEKASGGAIGIAEDVEIYATLEAPGATPTEVLFQVRAGERSVFAVDFGFLPQEIVDRRMAALAAATEAGNGEIEEAETLALLGAQYLRNLSRDLEDLAGWKWQRLVKLGTIGVTLQTGKVTTALDGSPLTFERAERFIDIASLPLGLFPVDSGWELATTELLGAQSSFLEGQIFDQILAHQGIAAVSALTRAQREGQDLIRVDGTNLDTVLPGLNLESIVTARLRRAIAQGQVAWVSESPVTVNRWRGAGYILEDPETGAAAFLLSGGFAGGASTQEILSELVQKILGSEPWFEGSILAQILEILGIAESDGPSSTQGDPVNLSSGNFWLNVADLSVLARGLPVFWMRTYNSQSNHVGPMGHGWTFNYGERLEEREDGSVLYREADGTEHLFTIEGNGFVAPTGKHFFLRKESNRFVLWHPTGLEQLFTLDGHLSQIRDANNNVVEVHYDASGHLTTIVDAAGRNVFTIKTEDQKITEVTDLEGRTVSFGYTGDNLTRVIDATGEAWTYAYDVNHNLIARVDPLGNIDSYTYDRLDRCTRHVDPTGASERFTYPVSGHSAVMTDARGFETYFEFDSRGRATLEVDPLGNTLQSTWDEDNNRSSTTDFRGGVTTRSFDDRGNLLSITNALGDTASLAYHPVYNLPTRIVDLAGSISTLVYDDKGNLELRRLEVDGEQYEERFVYDSHGQLIEHVDPRGITTRWVWDSQKGSLFQYESPAKSFEVETDSLGRIKAVSQSGNLTTSLTWNERHQPLAVELPFNNSVVTTYDALGRPTRIESPRGISEVSYDALGRILSQTDPAGNIVQMEYDSTGNIISRIDGNGELTMIIYDALGRPMAIADPIGSISILGYCGGQPKASSFCELVDPMGNVIRKEHDALGRLASIVDPLGNRTSFAYDSMGRMIERENALGKVTRFEHDSLGRIIAMTEPNKARTEYTYDGSNNLINIRDALGRDWRRTYYSNNRIQSEADPLGNKTGWTWDELGNLTQLETADGEIVRYEYEGNRQTGLVLPGERREEFGYNGQGRITSVKNDDMEVNREFDRLNRPTRVTDKKLAKEIRYQYNARGDLARLETPEGTVKYHYDALGRLVELVDPLTGRYVFDFDRLSRRTATHYPNGTTTSYAYDAASRLTAVITLDTRGEIVDGYSYEYDAIGQRTERRSLRDGLVDRFFYDDVGRLKRWERGDDHFEEYTYDLVGNRLHLSNPTTESDAEYDGADRLLSVRSILSSGDIIEETYSWDSKGNLLERSIDGAETSFEWDALNRLVAVHGAGHESAGHGTLSFGYDPYRIRIQEIDEDGTRRWLHSEEDIVATYDGSTREMLRYFAHGPGYDEPLAVVDEKGERHYLHRDALGSIRAITNSAGALTGYRNYHPFGTPTESSGPDLFFGFASREHDDTGLIYQRARYYDPSTGRFTGRDPLRVDGAPVDGTNLYSYAGNNPVVFTDPTGLYKVLAELWDFAVSMTVPALAGAFVSAGLSLLLAGLGFGFITADIVKLGADNVIKEQVTALTFWVGMSIGSPVGFTWSRLPVFFDRAPKPLVRLESEWFSGASIYFSLAGGILVVLGLTVLAWDVFDPAKAAARPSADFDDFTALGLDLGVSLGFPPFAWSYGF